MDSLFGVPLSSYLIALTLLIVLIFGFLGWIGWRNPLLVRMGLRNVIRRKTQTVLIVIGLMLSTLIISAAFATGDTVGYSITNEVYREMSKADIFIGFDREAAPVGVDRLSDADVAGLTAGIAGDQNLEGISGLTQTRVPAINEVDRRAEPLATFAGVDPATIGVFDGLIDLDGDPIDAGILGDDRVLVTERLSEKIGVEAGDRFTIFYDNEPFEFAVASVVRDNGMTSNVDQSEATATIGGFVTTLDRWREVTGEVDRIDFIVVSAVGGVRDSLDRVDPLHDRIEDYIAASGAPMQVLFTKTEAVGFAELLGSIFVTFFIVFGLFSIAAGILLIFLTFVMLAAERRPEMGMARAVGMKRTHLTETFVAEGMAYNLGSALVGALLGLGVAFTLVWFMARILSDFGLSITFHVNPQGFAIAYFLGVVITFITVAFSSWRAANLNIVAAIRDLPDAEFFHTDDRSLKRLGLATIAVIWTLAWIGLIAIWAVAAFNLFILGLATYGAGMVGGGLVAAFFVWGVSRINRGWGSMRWYGRVAYVIWWIAFSVMALLTWVLFRTRAWAARYRNSGGWALWMLIIGVLGVWWGGWVAQQAFAYTAGTTLVLFAVAMLAVYFGAAARPAFTIASFLSLWYWLLPLPFSLFVEDATPFFDPLLELSKVLGIEPAEELGGNIEMFFVSGIAMTASATVFFIFNVDRLLSSLNLVSRVLGGATPAVRTAISYPLASKFRTAMTLAMFGLVMFSLVVMATLNYNFTQLFFGEDAKGGFDVSVAANPSNRIPDLGSALTEAGYDVDGNIQGIGTLLTTGAEMRESGGTEPYSVYRLQGMDDDFAHLASFPLLARAAGYETDAAVFEALRTDPTVAIIDESRVREPDPFGPPNQSDFRLSQRVSQLQDRPWEPIPVSLRDPSTGVETEVRVIGVLQAQVTAVTPNWFALFTHRSVVEDYFDGGNGESFYLRTHDASLETTVEVASSIEAALLERGVVASSFQQTIDDTAAQSNAFQYLFEGFMGLGLIVGIAALGVIAFRTVAERRQQIGMMRAIGYSRRLIGVSFFLESSFIALAGIGMGLVLGVALSYNLLTNPEIIGEAGAEIDFAIPWIRLLIIVGIAYGASALMTLIPARSASRVPVAEALRYAG